MLYKAKAPLYLGVIVVFLSILACAESTPEVRPPQDTLSSLAITPESAAPKIPSPLPSPTNTLKPVGSARSNPAPFGYEVLTNNMTLKITEFIRPADEIVAQASWLNPTPEEGKEYVFVNLSVLCNRNTDESCSIIELEFKLVGSSGQARDPEIFLANVSGLFEGGEFFGGASKSGYLVFIIDKSETDLILIYQPLLSLSNDVYFSVEP